MALKRPAASMDAAVEPEPPAVEPEPPAVEPEPRAVAVATKLGSTEEERVDQIGYPGLEA